MADNRRCRIAAGNASPTTGEEAAGSADAGGQQQIAIGRGDKVYGRVSPQRQLRSNNRQDGRTAAEAGARRTARRHRGTSARREGRASSKAHSWRPPRTVPFPLTAQQVAVPGLHSAGRQHHAAAASGLGSLAVLLASCPQNCCLGPRAALPDTWHHWTTQTLALQDEAAF